VSFETPEYTANADAVGTLRLLEASRILRMEDKVRFYQASTSELYGKVQEIPQRETTPFYPRSPYAAAKLYAYWITVNYREAYGIHASNGILFNHEGPIRGETFVTRKITRAVASIEVGAQECLWLGNLDAKRDWGHTRDYVEGMSRIVQQDQSDDYVLATGEMHSVRDFVELAFAELGYTIAWQGSGLDEVGLERSHPGAHRSALLPARLAEMPLEKCLRYSAVNGHGGLKFFRETLDDLSRYHKIVTLRDPIERVISEYNYIRTRPQHRLHRVVAAGEFEAYVEETAQPTHQVKLLTGSTDDSEGAFEIVTRFLDDWCMSADVGQMAERLYQVTGTTPQLVAHKNKAKLQFSRLDEPPATLRAIEEQNRHDLVLLEALKRARAQLPVHRTSR
jgi:hypothetical protein